MEQIDLINKFIDFEEDAGLFEYRINGIEIWEFLRTNWFWDIREMITGVEEYWHPFYTYEHKGPWSKRLLYDKYIRRNYIYAKKRDVLIFSHARKVKDNSAKEQYKDIYTHLIDKKLMYSHYVIDRNLYDGAYIIQDSKNILTDDLGKFIRLYRKERMNVDFDVNIIERIICAIEEEFEIIISDHIREKWLGFVNFILSELTISEAYYNFLFCKIKPKLVMLVTYYDCYMQMLVRMAKKRGVPTVELQHALIGNLHPAYNFAKKRMMATFPDYVFCFGKYEAQNVKWPLSNNRIIPVGFPELESQSKLFFKENKQGEKRVILFISGDEEILNCAVNFSRIADFSKYHIIYKCHPSEYSVYEKTIAPLFLHSEVEIIHSNEKSIYYYIGMAEWVVGTNSTALFEATYFEARIAVLKSKTTYSCMKICEEKAGVLVNCAQELYDVIEGPQIKKEKTNVFFERDSINVINMTIGSIINGDIEKQSD